MGQDIAGYQIRIQDRICIHPQYCGRIMDPALTHNCNSYWCPSGTKPGYAHVLLLWKDLLALHPETSVTMTIVHNRVEYKIREMSIIKSQKISHGPLRYDSVHRVTLADKRYWINDKQLPTYVLANIYSPGGQRSPYLINSTFKGVTPGPFNPGDPPPSTTPKTWGNLVKELWPGAWGPPPTFTEPPFPPENIVLVGMNWAETFACILQMMGQRLIYIPFSNTFRFRPVGNESTVLPFNTPILDHSPLDKFQNINPSVIRVWFATKLEHYGTERDAHLVDNWLTDDATTFIDRFPGNLGFTIGKSPTSLNANMLAIMDKERNYVNEAELQEMATFHATNYLTDLNIHNYHRRFSGMKQLFPDGQIKAVRYGKTHKFLFTEIIRHPGEPTLDENGDMVYPKDYNPIASLHLPQRTIPEYPRVSQIVKMDDPETESDHIRFPLESVEGGADKRLHPAKLRHFPDADTDPRGGDLAEPDPWNAGTPYEVGDHVINDEKVYKNVNAGTGGDPPEHTSGTVDN